jgi:antitoxin component YwqK of YwqJK toxin-antitoxin module
MILEADQVDQNMNKILILFSFVLLAACSPPVEYANNIPPEGLEERQGINYEVNSQTPYSGAYRVSFEQGLDEGNYKDGKLDGLWKSYWSNGELYYSCYFKDGKLDGLFESFYDNGQLEYKECYKNGEKVDMSYCEK